MRKAIFCCILFNLFLVTYFGLKLCSLSYRSLNLPLYADDESKFKVYIHNRTNQPIFINGMVCSPFATAYISAPDILIMNKAGDYWPLRLGTDSYNVIVRSSSISIIDKQAILSEEEIQLYEVED